ncbi:MAG: methyltransferase domain-containing protein [Acidobacteria bacterium]|nr:MAG: methyltransferase domain-containing protein [Acidobacteriota bacterium]
MKQSMETEPRAYWDEEAGPRWAEAQRMIDRVLEPVSSTLVERAVPASGELVLDIGCGSGALSLEVAGRVGEAGLVVGVDVASSLVEQARSRSVGRPNVEFLLADAEEDPLPPSDLVLSRFGVMFFRDSRRAFANLRRALDERAGRLAVACWQSVELNPWITWPMAALGDLADRLERPVDPHADVPGPFRFADRDRLEQVLRDAGFVDVVVEAVARPLVLAGSAEEILGFTRRIGPLSRALGQLDETASGIALQRVAARLAELHDGREMRFDAAWWVASAQAG